MYRIIALIAIIIGFICVLIDNTNGASMWFGVAVGLWFGGRIADENEET